MAPLVVCPGVHRIPWQPLCCHGSPGSLENLGSLFHLNVPSCGDYFNTSVSTFEEPNVSNSGGYNDILNFSSNEIVHLNDFSKQYYAYLLGSKPYLFSGIYSQERVHTILSFVYKRYDIVISMRHNLSTIMVI